MFRFENISALHLLWLLIPIGLWFVYKIINDKKRLNQIGDYRLIELLLPGRSQRLVNLKSILLFLGLAFILFSASNPQWGTRKEKVKALSSDVYIAFDISQSMLAEDISPSRIERAKKFAEKLILALKGNRIGIIFFAGDAYLQMPLTNDYATAQLMIKAANTNMAGTQGTAIDDAIVLAGKAFSDDADFQRAVVVISDGEDHDQEAVDAVQKAKSKGLTTFSVGVGTEQGSYIPISYNGRQQYKKDEEGNPVLTSIDIKYLQDLAINGGGEFYLVNQGSDAIKDLVERLDRLQKREVEQRSFTNYESYFQWFLLIGFLLIIIEWLIPNVYMNKQK